MKKEKFFNLDIPFMDLLQAKAKHWEKGRAVASFKVKRKVSHGDTAI